MLRTVLCVMCVNCLRLMDEQSQIKAPFQMSEDKLICYLCNWESDCRSFM